MEMKFIRVYMLSDDKSKSPEAAKDGLVNTYHIKRIVEQPATDDDKISFGLRFKDKKKMIDTVCELQMVDNIWIRIPYTEAEFMKMYKNTRLAGY
jgi:hypothetical protein